VAKEHWAGPYKRGTGAKTDNKGPTMKGGRLLEDILKTLSKAPTCTEGTRGHVAFKQLGMGGVQKHISKKTRSIGGEILAYLLESDG